MITDSLFYTGGTISKNDCINTVDNYKLAFNRDFLFVLDSKYNIITTTKYQEYSNYVHRPLKTKIQIHTKSDFLETMRLKEDRFYSCVQSKVLNKLLSNNKNNKSVIKTIYELSK